jgi:hypothetical protein
MRMRKKQTNWTSLLPLIASKKANEEHSFASGEEIREQNCYNPMRVHTKTSEVQERTEVQRSKQCSPNGKKQ